MPGFKGALSRLLRRSGSGQTAATTTRADNVDPAHTPSLELRIPISANDKYMRMLHYLLESLLAFGGPIGRAAHSIVSVSADEPRIDIEQVYPWVHNYSVEFHWLEQDLFDKHDYDATGYHRFWVKSSGADVIALVDADILVSGDFDAIVRQCYLGQQVLGAIAHVSPFDADEYRDVSSEAWWGRLFAEAGLPMPEMKHQHTGWGLMTSSPGHRYCPAYFNYGFILVPRQDIDRLGQSFVGDLEVVDRVVDTWFKSQIANNIAFVRHGIPTGALPLKYNFPLHVSCDAMRAANPDPEGQDAAEDIRIFHYLGEGEVHKGHFASEETLREVLERTQMSEAGAFFQARLRHVHARIESSAVKRPTTGNP